jgi:glycosyltransferase involved in cell wall biosynthesis
VSIVSVIVPTRDRRELLATTLYSVLWQRDVQLEVIVVDDGSIDDTERMVTDLGDTRVTMVRHVVPKGLSAARNSGAQRARGEWIGFVDDDDVWAPDKLARQIRAAEQSGSEWVYVGAVNIDARLEIVSAHAPPTPDQVVAALPRYNPIPGGGSNVILKHRLLTEVGGFDERFSACEDWELWSRLARLAPPASVAHPLMGYRLHDGSMSLDTERILRAARLIERVHHTSVDWGRMHRWLAESCLRAGARTEALRHLAEAAVRGQARGVASDLNAIVHRRLSSRFGREAGPVSLHGCDWNSEAAAWLGELARRVSAGADEAGHR